MDRIVAKAAGALIKEIDFGFTEVSRSAIDSVLLGEEPLPSVIEGLEEVRGGHILTCGDLCVPVWIGGRVSLMLNDSEKTIIHSQRGFIDQMEEE